MEVIIASAIVLLISIVLISANLSYYRTSASNLKNIKATYLIEEGIEVANFLKNNDWLSLGDINTDYYLVWSGLAWSATTSQTYVDQVFNRKYITENVYRDANSDIALNGTVDENTRKLTVQVSWQDTQTNNITKFISSYLMKNNE